MKLASEIVGEDSHSLFDSAAVVYDSDILDPQLTSDDAAVVAIVLYSVAGNIIIRFRDGYDATEIMLAGEKTVGQTFAADRFKEYRATVIKGDEKCQRKSK